LIPADSLLRLRQRLDQLPSKSPERADYGKPRKLPRSELKHYCELIAAFKLRTANIVFHRSFPSNFLVEI
jgi:hypothetical protein